MLNFLYTTTAWINTYETNLRAINFSIADEVSSATSLYNDSDIIYATIMVAPGGRFRESLGRHKRKRALTGEVFSHASGAVNQTCSNCGQVGHNARNKMCRV